MIESELNKKVMQKLNEFEAIEEIQPTSDWSLSLMNRLDNTKPNSSSRYTPMRFAAIIVFFVLINIVFILNINHSSQQNLGRNLELQIISKELLVNSNMINN